MYHMPCQDFLQSMSQGFKMVPRGSRCVVPRGLFDMVPSRGSRFVVAVPLPLSFQVAPSHSSSFTTEGSFCES